MKFKVGDIISFNKSVLAEKMNIPIITRFNINFPPDGYSNISIPNINILPIHFGEFDIGSCAGFSRDAKIEDFAYGLIAEVCGDKHNCGYKVFYTGKLTGNSIFNDWWEHTNSILSFNNYIDEIAGLVDDQNIIDHINKKYLEYQMTEIIET